MATRASAQIAGVDGCKAGWRPKRGARAAKSVPDEKRSFSQHHEEGCHCSPTISLMNILGVKPLIAAIQT
jgi:hypothetical protein